MKKCRDCGEERPLGDFYPHEGCALGVRPECKSCSCAKKAAVYSAKKAAVYKAAPEKHWARALLAKYGITVGEYDRLLAAQRGVCAICGASDPGRGDNYLLVDLDHATGRVRGLLCTNCNRALGYFQDDPERLIRAATYLHQAPALVGERTEATT